MFLQIFLVSGQAAAAENIGGAQTPTARGPEATAATTERRETTASQVSQPGAIVTSQIHKWDVR